MKDLINLKMYKDHNYFVYITTNIKKNVLYTGITNDLYTRLTQHKKIVNSTKPLLANIIVII